MPPQRTSLFRTCAPKGLRCLIGVARDCGAPFGVKQYVIDGITDPRRHQTERINLGLEEYRQTGCFDWIRSNQPSSPCLQHPTRSGPSAIDSRSGRPRFFCRIMAALGRAAKGNPSNSRLSPSHRSRRNSSRSSRRVQPRLAAELWCREAGQAAQPCRRHRAKPHNAHSRKQQVLHFYFHLFSAPSLVRLNSVRAKLL